MPGAFEGETVTRRGLMTGGALAAGGIASAAFALPALGFALGPILEDNEPREVAGRRSRDRLQPGHLRLKVMTLVADVGEAGKTTVYIRKATEEDRSPSDGDRHDPAVRRDLHPLRAPRLPGPLRAGVREVHLPVPRRRLRQGRQRRRRPARPSARPLLHKGRERPRARGQALLRRIRSSSDSRRATRRTTSTACGSTSTRRGRPYEPSPWIQAP